MPDTRVEIWSEGGEHITAERLPNGDVTLMRSTDWDSGPSRVITIPASARAAAVDALLPNPTRGWEPNQGMG